MTHQIYALAFCSAVLAASSLILASIAIRLDRCIGTLEVMSTAKDRAQPDHMGGGQIEISRTADDPAPTDISIDIVFESDGSVSGSVERNPT